MKTMLVLTACVLMQSTANADPLQEQGIVQAAQEIAKTALALADEEGGLTITVGQFANGTGTQESSEAIIQAELNRALGAKAVKEDGGLTITGDYDVSSPKIGPRVVEISAKIKRRDGQLLKNLKEKFIQQIAVVKKFSDQIRLVPHTGIVPPFAQSEQYKGEVATLDERTKALNNKPTAAVKNKTLVLPIAGSDYAVEVRTKKKLGGDATPLEIIVKDGRASVSPIAKDELYDVRILNFGPNEVAASLHIDGLSEFEFTRDRKPDGTPSYSHSILAPAGKDGPGEALIEGWHDRFDATTKEHHFLAFLVTEYGKGAISKFPTKSRSTVGVISVTFALSHPKGSGRNGGETGFGPPGKQAGEVVQREIDPPIANVSIRYQR